MIVINLQGWYKRLWCHKYFCVNELMIVKMQLWVYVAKL